MDSQNQNKRNLLEVIHRKLSLIYPQLQFFQGYEKFREFRLNSFSSKGDSGRYNIFRYNSNDKARGEAISNNLPMLAEYIAIAQEGTYRSISSKQLIEDRLISAEEFLGGWRTPAGATLKGMSRQTILLGLGNDSLVIDLSVFPPKLKSLDDYGH